MKQRLLYAPIPILISAGLVALDFFTENHYGVAVLILIVTVGCTLETSRGFLEEEQQPPLLLLGFTTLLCISWIGLNILVPSVPLDLLKQGFENNPAISTGYIILFLPLLVGFSLFLIYGITQSHPQKTKGILMSFALMTLFIILFSHCFLVFQLFPENPDRATLWLLFLGINNKLSDTGAYVVGKYAGSNNMTPTLSPQKTWEGAAGAIGTGLLVGLFFFRFTGLGLSHSVQHMLLVSLVFSISGIFGDLTGSLLKRAADMDDSSELLSGIGGILDMSDSFLMSLPVAFFWFYLVL